MTPPVTDSVWHGLDPAAARLSRRVRRRVGVLVVTVLTAAAAGAWLWSSGAVVPHLESHGWDTRYEYGTTTDYPFNQGSIPTRHLSHGFRLTNTGSLPLEIVSAANDEAGLRVERVEVGDVHVVEGNGWAAGGRPLTAKDPHRLAPGESVTVRIYYEVTDCSAVSAGPVPIAFRVARFWGEQTVDLSLAPLHVTNSGWAITDARDPDAVQWQQYLADAACGVLPR